MRLKIKDIPFYLAVLTVVYTVVYFLFTDGYDYMTETKIGVSSIALCLILFFINRKIFSIVFLLTLGIGSLGLLSFSPSYLTTSFSFHHFASDVTLGVTFSPYPFILLITFLALRIDVLKKYRQKRDKEHDISEAHKTQERIEYWKKKFGKKSQQELVSMFDSKAEYNLEAQQAIEQLLSEKDAL